MHKSPGSPFDTQPSQAILHHIFPTVNGRSFSGWEIDSIPGEGVRWRRRGERVIGPRLQKISSPFQSHDGWTMLENSTAKKQGPTR